MKIILHIRYIYYYYLIKFFIIYIFLFLIINFFLKIILTKSDASSTIEKKNALQSCFNEIMAKRMSSCLPVVHLLSSKDSTGVIQLQQSIAEIANHQWAKTKIPLQPSKISQGLYPTPETNIELAEEIKSSLPGGWESYIDGEDTDLIIDKLNNAIINNK